MYGSSWKMIHFLLKWYNCKGHSFNFGGGTPPKNRSWGFSSGCRGSSFCQITKLRSNTTVIHSQLGSSRRGLGFSYRYGTLEESLWILMYTWRLRRLGMQSWGLGIPMKFHGLLLGRGSTDIFFKWFDLCTFSEFFHQRMKTHSFKKPLDCAVAVFIMYLSCAPNIGPWTPSRNIIVFLSISSSTRSPPTMISMIENMVYSTFWQKPFVHKPCRHMRSFKRHHICHEAILLMEEILHQLRLV